MKNIADVLTRERLNRLAYFLHICKTVDGYGLDAEQIDVISALIAFYAFHKEEEGDQNAD